MYIWSINFNVMNKQNIQTYILLFSTVIISFFLSSCNKERVAHKIEGSWDKVWVEDLKTTSKERWIFKSDNTLIIMRNFYNATHMDYMDTIEVGRWKVDMKFDKNHRRLDIYDLKDGNVDYYNGEWDIINLKEDELFIVNKEVGRLFREFTRQKS